MAHYKVHGCKAPNRVAYIVNVCICKRMAKSEDDGSIWITFNVDSLLCTGHRVHHMPSYIWNERSASGTAAYKVDSLQHREIGKPEMKE